MNAVPVNFFTGPGNEHICISFQFSYFIQTKLKGIRLEAFLLIKSPLPLNTYKICQYYPRWGNTFQNHRQDTFVSQPRGENEKSLPGPAPLLFAHGWVTGSGIRYPGVTVENHAPFQEKAKQELLEELQLHSQQLVHLETTSQQLKHPVSSSEIVLFSWHSVS